MAIRLNEPNEYTKGLTEETGKVFEDISRMECIKELYLVGGTAQSLQMQHRLSEDLDFELLGTKKERPQLQFGKIIQEINKTFPDAKKEILGDDHFLMYISDGKVKLSFYRPDNPVQSLTTGFTHNNLKTVNLQELLGMKLYTICLRSKFRDYYDIYYLLKNGQNLDKAIDYASYLSRRTIRSKAILTALTSPMLYQKDDEFEAMQPRIDISSKEIADYIQAQLIKKIKKKTIGKTP